MFEWQNFAFIILLYPGNGSWGTRQWMINKLMIILKVYNQYYPFLIFKSMDHGKKTK